MLVLNLSQPSAWAVLYRTRNNFVIQESNINFFTVNNNNSFSRRLHNKKHCNRIISKFNNSANYSFWVSLFIFYNIDNGRPGLESLIVVLLLRSLNQCEIYRRVAREPLTSELKFELLLLTHKKWRCDAYISIIDTMTWYILTLSIWKIGLVMSSLSLNGCTLWRHDSLLQSIRKAYFFATVGTHIFVYLKRSRHRVGGLTAERTLKKQLGKLYSALGLE